MGAMHFIPTSPPAASVQPARLQQALLSCGIAAPLVYLAGDLLAAMRWAEYRIADQNVSELMAIGAPTRPLIAAFFVAFNLLAIAFGLGVRASADQRRSLRAAGVLLAAYGAVGFLGLAAPMHLRSAEASFTDSAHIVVTAVLAVLTVLFIACGSGAGGRSFRLYSLATIAMLAAFGLLTARQGSRLADGLPTPWMGLTERVNIYGSMLWMAVLSVSLLRGRGPLRHAPDSPR